MSTHNMCFCGQIRKIVSNIFSWRFGHEIFSMVILFLPLIQEGQLSVSGKRMCTLLVNHLGDSLPSKSVIR